MPLLLGKILWGPACSPPWGVGGRVPLARGTKFWALTSTPRLSGLASDPVMPPDGKEIFGAGGCFGLFWRVDGMEMGAE